MSELLYCHFVVIIICIDHFLLTVSMLKRPRTPPTNSLAMDYQTADSESVLKRPRPFGISDGVSAYFLDGF